MPEIPIHPDYCVKIFLQSINDYHIQDNTETPEKNPYNFDKEYIEHLLYKKNWIDTVQWHLEDIIRDPLIDPAKGLAIKRQIDESNQKRNDTVEKIDEWLVNIFKNFNMQVKKDARLNSESPAWIIDRISILCLKIYHMEIEIKRQKINDTQNNTIKGKLLILNEQLQDLSKCLQELFEDIINGEKFMKVYRQMKMYNDPEMNPVLYKNVRNG